MVVRRFGDGGQIVQHHENRIGNSLAGDESHAPMPTCSSRGTVTRQTSFSPFLAAFVRGRHEFAPRRKCGPKTAGILEILAAECKLNCFPRRQSQWIELRNLRRCGAQRHVVARQLGESYKKPTRVTHTRYLAASWQFAGSLSTR